MVTMRPEDILELTEKPETISSASLQSLKQQINAYPWFTVAKLLYLKGLAHSDSDKYSSELRKMAISIPDRQRLFNLINSGRFNLEEEESPTEETISDNSFSLIDSFLTEHKDEQSPATDEKILAHSSVSNDYMIYDYEEVFLSIFVLSNHQHTDCRTESSFGNIGQRFGSCGIV